MTTMRTLTKLQRGDKVAILSMSFCAPGLFPEVFELGLQRLQDIFQLVPVEYPTTRQVSSSVEDRIRDLLAAFQDPDVKAVITSIGGDHQVEFMHQIPTQLLADNAKPFFGFSDNSHLCNLLWLQGVPSAYGGHVMMQFAEHGEMDAYTISSLERALFGPSEEVELLPSRCFNEVDVPWEGPPAPPIARRPTPAWIWDGHGIAEGITWGGCLESIDEMLRCNCTIPSLKAFEDIILIAETSEELPSVEYVQRVYRALGVRGLLQKCKGFVIGRPKAWFFGKERSEEERDAYRNEQLTATLQVIRRYNADAPVVMNVDIGHTNPQICMPYGGKVRIDGQQKRLFCHY